MTDFTNAEPERKASQSITFNLTIEDVVKYYLYFYNHTKLGVQLRNKSRLQLLFLKAALFLCLGLILDKIVLHQSGLWFTIGVCVFGTVASYLQMILNHSNVLRNMVVKIDGGRENEALYGERTLTVSDSGLVHRTNCVESKLGWSVLENIETDLENTYLIFGSNSPIIIPHKSITQGDLGSFLNAIKTHYKPGQLLESAEQSKMSV